MKPEPLDDRVLIIPDSLEQKTAGGIFIPDSAAQYDKKRKGTVIAHGTGHVADNTGEFTPITVQVGDRVSFASFAGQKMEAIDLDLPEGEYLLINERDLEVRIVEGELDLIKFYEEQIAILRNKSFNDLGIWKKLANAEVERMDRQILND